MGDRWRNLTVDEIKAATAGSVAIGPFGSRMKSDLYVENGVPVIRGLNISRTRELVGEFVFVSPETADDLRSSNVFPDDLIFPHRGAIGEVGIVPEGRAPRYVLSTSLMKLTCDPEMVDPKFVFYFFRSPKGRHELLKHSSTVGTPGIGQPLSSLKSIILPVPPLEEQQSVAATLGALDDKIDLNQQMNETLEAIARAIFKSWFVDFDPVRSKMQGRQPVGVPADIAALFPNSLEPSSIGDTPAGWDLAPLPQIIELNPLRELKVGSETPYLEMANVPMGSARVIGWEKREFKSGTRFINGDVLLARITPSLEHGKTVFVDFLEDGQVGCGSTEFIVMRSRPPLPPEYAYFLARTDELRDHAITNMTGSSGRQRVPVSCFDNYLVTVPPLDLAVHFGNLARPLMKRMKANDDESSTLAQLRDTLLPKLVSGEMSVRIDTTTRSKVSNGPG